MATVAREWMIYGATGYTGRLVTREAAARGLRPLLGGRDAARVEELAGSLHLPCRVFTLNGDDTRKGLAGVDLLLHCAGPFAITSEPMVRACLATGTHYLDITGEIAVLERVLALDRGARAAGIVLLPGVGFDVVPSDCLAARLAASLPSANQLDLAFASSGGWWSAGTLKTAVESLPVVGAIRREGRIERVPPAHEVRELDFSFGRRMCTTIAWGDVSTAYHTTGIPNVRVFAAMRPGDIARLRRLHALVPLTSTTVAKRALQWWIGRHVSGPDDETRKVTRVSVWGQVRSANGQVATAAVETPEAYAFTALAAVESVVRVLAGRVPAGAWTPARAFGPEFASHLPGVESGPVSIQGRSEGPYFTGT
jgi:short subunit dehydrogenase-like uncharacterized protein